MERTHEFKSRTGWAVSLKFHPGIRKQKNKWCVTRPLPPKECALSVRRRVGCTHFLAHRSDMDEIYQDLTRKPDVRKIVERKPDLDLPGTFCSRFTSSHSSALGNFYCIACARYFNSQEIMDTHCTTKAHKKRCKQLATVKAFVSESYVFRKCLMALTLKKSMGRLTEVLTSHLQTLPQFP